jgi:hypothetical protein
MHAAGKVPDCVKVGGSTRWRRADLEEWVAFGCPGRAEFETRQAAHR